MGRRLRASEGAIGLAAMLLSVTGTWAEEGEEARAVLETCLEAKDDPVGARACIGVVAGPCLDASPAGGTVAGVTVCTRAEAAAWEAILDATYGELVLASRSVAEFDIEAGLPVGHREETLRAAERAWIAFRDADCAHAVAALGRTGEAATTAAWCRLEHDAQRTLVLRGRLAAFGD